MKSRLVSFMLFLPALLFTEIHGQPDLAVNKKKGTPRIIYGTASYYHDKFNGRKTANGEIFSQRKMTAACNVLPMGTWIKVTNIRNGRWVVVRTNDRLHPRMKRVVDLSRIAAQKLGYVSRGIARVKVEVLGMKKPTS